MKTLFFLARLLWFETIYFCRARFQSVNTFYCVCVSVYVWIWVTFNESLVCLSVYLPVCLPVSLALRASVFVLFHQKEQKIAFLPISSLTTVAFFEWNLSVAWCFRRFSCFFLVFFFVMKFVYLLSGGSLMITWLHCSLFFVLLRALITLSVWLGSKR